MRLTNDPLIKLLFDPSLQSCTNKGELSAWGFEGNWKKSNKKKYINEKGGRLLVLVQLCDEPAFSAAFFFLFSS